MRPFPPAAANGAHERRQIQRLRGIRRLPRRDEPIEFVFVDGIAQPSEHQTSRADRRHLAQRNSQRELEKRRRALAEAEKCALDFAPALAHILHDRQQPRLRVADKPATAPQGARRQLSLRIGSGVKAGVGRLAGLRLAPDAPEIENLPLHGQNPVEAGEQQGRALRNVALQEPLQFEGKARRRNQAAGAAEAFEIREPAAEYGCILLPQGPRSLIQELRGVIAEQLMRLHGQSGQSMARPFEHGASELCRADDIGP